MKLKVIFVRILLLLCEIIVAIGISLLINYICNKFDDSNSYVVNIVVGVAASFIASFVIQFFDVIRLYQSKMKQIQSIVVNFMHRFNYVYGCNICEVTFNDEFIKHITDCYFDVCNIALNKKHRFSQISSLIKALNDIRLYATRHKDEREDYCVEFNNLTNITDKIW